MSDNPFSEPADNDRTVIRPTPGGRRPVATPRAPAPPAPPRPATSTAKPAPLPAVDPSAPPAISVSPLAVAASPLLQLLNRLRGMHRAPDLRALRERAEQDLRAFERQARDAGIAMEVLRPAHYALCASIDDVVLNTPWGAASGWADKTLVASLHPGARGTDQFFEQLRQMQKTPGKFLPVIELMVLCLSLGFMGRYRQARGEGGARSGPRRCACRDRGAASGGRSRSCRGAGAVSRRRTGRGGAGCRSGSHWPVRSRCAAVCCSGSPPA